MSAGLVVRYEDEHLAVVEKPAGIHTAPLRQGERGTLLEAVLDRFPEVARVPGIRPVEPGLLHRLDRDTSGLVVVARTPRAFAALRASFESGAACKDYAACTALAGARTAPAGARPVETTVTSRFAPWGPGRKKVRVVAPGEVRRAVLRGAAAPWYTTTVQVLRGAGALLLVQARIDRGFRHQVRAHLAHAGLPIVGDALYGVPAPPGAPARMYLHASRIEFPHPVTGAPLSVASPLPPEFDALLAMA